MMTKMLFSRGSKVHWPSQFFDEEMRQYRVNEEIVWREIPRSGTAALSADTKEAAEPSSMDAHTHTHPLTTDTDELSVNEDLIEPTIPDESIGDLLVQHSDQEEPRSAVVSYNLYEIGFSALY